jgi:hypothetical protein
MRTPLLMSTQGLIGIPKHVAGSAISNARQSLLTLGRAIEDRATVMEQLQHGGAPGDVSALSDEECWSLIGSRSVGRFVYVARAGHPDVVPVNYVLHGRDILIRSAPGPKLQAAERGERVAFEVDDLDGEGQQGWSVVVSGTATVLSLREAALLPAPLPWASGPRRHTFRIRARRISGRQLT